MKGLERALPLPRSDGRLGVVDNARCGRRLCSHISHVVHGDDSSLRRSVSMVVSVPGSQFQVLRPEVGCVFVGFKHSQQS